MIDCPYCLNRKIPDYAIMCDLCFEDGKQDEAEISELMDRSEAEE